MEFKYKPFLYPGPFDVCEMFESFFILNCNLIPGDTVKTIKIQQLQIYAQTWRIRNLMKNSMHKQQPEQLTSHALLKHTTRN